jgi:uncharacterized membrane-anchored protein YjiN (DUF445 family)
MSSVYQFTRRAERDRLEEQLSDLHERFSAISRTRPTRIRTAYDRALTDFVDNLDYDPQNDDNLVLRGFE